MSSRILFCAVAASVLTLLSACSSGGNPGDEIGSQTGEINDGLESRAVVKGSVPQGGSVTINYRPEDPYLAGVDGVPFLGAEILTAGAEPGYLARSGQELSISVSGDFPGAPTVVVVDESFRVLAQAEAPSPEEGDHVSLSVPLSQLPRFVFVRDMRWVEPMDFEIATLLK